MPMHFFSYVDNNYFSEVITFKYSAINLEIPRFILVNFVFLLITKSSLIIHCKMLKS